ncbi:transposase [Gloeomargarita lithophora Alchichica-D10]|uniref:Transposase n=1 Tax=Gloeomargarita lithophora Alchichica-D10 TaxID=1188229 RepID=A0A1J0AC89_9CYAN|nr:transposase [Gloeomargarita lithophora Alchichica-D10]
MILNGLGFVSAPLYLFARFFVDKPVAHLLGCVDLMQDIAKHVKVDIITWVAGRRPALVFRNLETTTLLYLAIEKNIY